MSAKPFLRPALDESEEKIVQTFAEAVNRGIANKTQRGTDE